MNYLDIQHCNMVNYSGLRTVIWVAGCERKCPGCFSPYTHDFCAGIEFDEKAKSELFRDSSEEWCAGITIVGGEPLHDRNFDVVLSIVKEHKSEYPDKTICIYTGFKWSEIVSNPKKSEILKYIDVLIDGPFIESMKSPELHWVGSSNQEVIDVKQRIAQISAISCN